MDKSTGKFTITNNGIQTEYDVLFTFDNEETKKNYIVFTDNTLDENNNIKVYANTYNPETMDLGAIETEKEWQLIENLLADLQEKVGEDDEQPARK
ncbi:MAG: DUF1292 domain-containing protein [Bacilli bacterium]|nr:DUF1292 domain-containing protein [Bacilli bacterium]